MEKRVLELATLEGFTWRFVVVAVWSALGVVGLVFGSIIKLPDFVLILFSMEEFLHHFMSASFCVMGIQG